MAAVLGWRLARIMPLADSDTMRTLVKIALASVAMAAALMLGLRVFGTPSGFFVAAAQLAVLVAAGLAIYAALLRAFGVVTFDQARAALKREG